MNWYTNFTTLFWFSSFYFKKGDECNYGNTYLNTCKLLTECPNAVQMIQNHQNPVLCGYNKYMPMVCCPHTFNQISTTESILHEPDILTHRYNTPTIHTSSNVAPSLGTPLPEKIPSRMHFGGSEKTNQIPITTPISSSFTTHRNIDESTTQLSNNMSTTQISTAELSIDVPTTEAVSNGEISTLMSPSLEARTTGISELECTSFRNVELQQREKLDYRDAEQEKLESINNEIVEFPYRVVLGVSTSSNGNVFVAGGIKWQCGGSLISSKFVLTAAHCLYYKNLEWANIGNALLHTYTRLVNPQKVLYKIIRRIPHPLYKPPSFYHNIGLVELDRPVEFTLYTRPACLHVGPDIDPNTQLIAAGWRLENFGETGETLVKLQNVNLDLFTEDECERTYTDLSGSGRLSTGIAHKEQFCAGARNNITSSCKIFSGGALQLDVNNSSNGIFYITGIKSFGNTCGLKGVPSVYTRIAAYIPWIESVVWPQSHDQIPAPEPVSDAFATLSSPRLSTSLSDEKCTYLKFGQVDAQAREFPHMVALGRSSDKNENDIIWECGGTLISEKFVLTSALCLTRNLTWANIGDKNLFTYLTLQNKEQLVYKIIRQIPHPLYQAPTTYHDIALVELDRPVEFNKYARPACLHEGQDIDSRTQFLAAGWDLIHKSSYSSLLRKVNLNILTNEECMGVYKSFYGNRIIPNGILHDYQFCAGGHIGIQDTCLIDAGGALQFKESNYTGNMWHIFGVTSSGRECGRNGLPKIYTRIAPYVSWIESIVWPQSNSQAQGKVLLPSLKQTPLTGLTINLSLRKCLYFREAELKERNLIFKPLTSGGLGGTGGTDAGAGEFPHMVALGYSKSTNDYDIAWQCGGSLLSEKFIITAAHCLVSREFGNLKWALLGTTRTDAYLKSTHPEQLLRKIIRRIKHPQYKLPGKYHDIALLELDRPVPLFTRNISPACLYTRDTIDTSTQVIGTGWGVTETGNVSIDLQKINLNLFTDEECDKAYEFLKGMRQLRSGILNNNQICAGGRHGIQDTCPGDSGGPLQFRDSMIVWQIVGITSFGKTCGIQGVPGVYTRVAAYVPWIESVIWPDEYIYQDEPEIIDA